MKPPSNLDLAGQASEDEKRPPATPLHSQFPPVSSSPSGSADSNSGRNAAGPSSSSTLATSSSGILSFLPSPIDLWEKRTATSLLLLPIVFCIYAILQLPLHYNSKNTVRKVNDLSETEWKGRAREVDELSNKLHHVKKELRSVNKNQQQMKGTVHALRHRLHHLKVRRGQREVYLNTLKRNSNNCTGDDKNTIIEQDHSKGVAKDGPLASLSIVEAASVATFVGKNGSVDTVKKED
mmetsp:Transcript_7683/g.12671  ORF Transcript_7683/g.12671 Transcript_7683/m.12671 type:complete len:237 (-) Transcript_7683:23-733(-)